MRTLSDEIHVARKHYECDACWHWLQSGYSEMDVSADQALVIQAAEADKWKIKPGQKYRRATYVDGGDFQTFRARIDMDKLVYKLGFYEE